MKITMYELLGLVKDDKAPKKIKFRNEIYEYKNNIEDGFIDYVGIEKETNERFYLSSYIGNNYISDIFTDEVEIIDDERNRKGEIRIMDKEEIKDYLKRVDELEAKLTGEDKETLQWLIYGYNQCAKLLNETEQQVQKQKEVIDRILSETKETRNILNNNRDDNMLSKSCLLSYLEIVEDLLKEVSE